jgi:hypothetical protein
MILVVQFARTLKILLLGWFKLTGKFSIGQHILVASLKVTPELHMPAENAMYKFAWLILRLNLRCFTFQSY